MVKTKTKMIPLFTGYHCINLIYYSNYNTMQYIKLNKQEIEKRKYNVIRNVLYDFKKFSFKCKKIQHFQS